jgi:hypothetical protein
MARTLLPKWSPKLTCRTSPYLEDRLKPVITSAPLSRYSFFFSKFSPEYLNYTTNDYHPRESSGSLTTSHSHPSSFPFSTLPLSSPTPPPSPSSRTAYTETEPQLPHTPPPTSRPLPPPQFTNPTCPCPVPRIGAGNSSGVYPYASRAQPHPSTASCVLARVNRKTKTAVARHDTVAVPLRPSSGSSDA